MGNLLDANLFTATLTVSLSAHSLNLPIGASKLSVVGHDNRSKFTALKFISTSGGEFIYMAL